MSEDTILSENAIKLLRELENGKVYKIGFCKKNNIENNYIDKLLTQIPESVCIYDDYEQKTTFYKKSSYSHTKKVTFFDCLNRNKIKEFI